VNADQRFYASNLGRFMSADPYSSGGRSVAGPIQTSSWNRYAYASNDPINRFDPQGTCDEPTTYRIDNDGILIVIGSTPCRGSSPSGDSGSGSDSGRDDSGRLQKLLDQVCDIPDHPSNLPSVDSMVTETKKVMTQAIQYHSEDPISDLVGFLINSFSEKGQWDFKSKEKENTSDRAGAQNFGNFAFGAVMQSMGLSYYSSQNAAGIAQIFISARGGASGTGIPFVTYPFGDQKVDAQVIQMGWNYERTVQAGKCP
jgi:RHS repeat-associated protein